MQSSNFRENLRVAIRLPLYEKYRRNFADIRKTYHRFISYYVIIRNLSLQKDKRYPCEKGATAR